MDKNINNKLLNRFVTYFFIRDMDKTTPFRKSLHKGIWLFYLMFKDFGKNMCFVHSGSLAYITIVSLIPMAVLIISIAGAYGVGDMVINYLKNNIFPYLAPEFHQQLGYWLESNISQNAFRGLSLGVTNLIAIVSLLIASTAIIVMSERVFNEIWRVKKGSSYFRKITGFWIFFTTCPLLILGNSYFKNTFMPTGGNLDIWVHQNPLLRVIYFYMVPFLITLFIMSMLQAILPRTKVLFKSALLGGAFSALLWEITKRFFYLYVGRMARVTSFYGTLATIPLFLIWMYTTWMFILLGAELAYSYQNRRLLTNMYRGYGDIKHHYTHAYLGVSLLIWMNSFYRVGKSIPTLDKFCDTLGVPLNTMTEVGDYLTDLAYLDPVKSDIPKFVFAQNPEYIALNEVMDKLLKMQFAIEYHLTDKHIPTEKILTTDEIYIKAQEDYLKPFANKMVSDFKTLML